MRDYRNIDPNDAAGWYAHDQGLLELQQERAQELASERTETDVKDLAKYGEVTLANGFTYALDELIDRVDGEFFICYMIDNTQKYFADKDGNKFMTEMMLAAAEKCSDVIYKINYEAL